MYDDGVDGIVESQLRGEQGQPLRVLFTQDISLSGGGRVDDQVVGGMTVDGSDPYSFVVGGLLLDQGLTYLGVD